MRNSVRSMHDIVWQKQFRGKQNRKHKSKRPFELRKKNLQCNAITDITKANSILQDKYGPDAWLIIFEWKGQERFKFIGVKIMEDYPAYGFKSVQKAMNALIAHMNGVVQWRKEQREEQNNQLVSA